MVETEEQAKPESMTDERWVRHPGETFTFPEPCYTYPGHPFTTDPRGGIFDTRTKYEIEDFDALVRRNRGIRISADERAFMVCPSTGAGIDPQLIVKR